jgi:hypothetical protein
MLAIIALFADVVIPASRRIDLHALIEEAKRRAAATPGVSQRPSSRCRPAASAAGPALTGESANPRAPPGFAVVKARGRVAHAVIQYSSSVRLTSLARQDRPTKTIEEVWYDARGGLWRDVVRIDGRVRRDRSGT